MVGQNDLIPGQLPGLAKPLHLEFIVEHATVYYGIYSRELYSSISKEAFLKQMLGTKVSVELNGVKQDAVDCSQLPHICHLEIFIQ